MNDRTEIIEPARLDAASRQRLIDEMYACHERIFDGVDQASFARYVVESPAALTRIMLLRDAMDAVRGYAAFHVFEQGHLGQPSAVIRMEVGVEPAWRGRGFCAHFMIREFALARVRYWNRRMFFVACFVHPSSFVSLTRHCAEVWPQPEVETPAEVQTLMTSLAERFGLRPTERAGVYDIGWIVRGGRGRRTLSPEAAFYVESNPGYRAGHGLLTVIPVTASAVARGTADYLQHNLRRTLRQRLALGPAPSRATVTD